MSATETWEQAVLWLRSQPDQTALVQAAFYDDPIINAATRYADSTEWQAVRALIPEPTGRALDIGAGRGISSFALARDGWDVVALEPDPSHVVGAGAIRSLSAESGVPIEIVQTWGEKLPFAEETFDLVYCRAVLHHAHDLKDLCREAARVLKPGGTMIATREHVISSPDDLPAFLGAHPLHDRYGGEHAYLLHEYRVALKSAGLIQRKILNPFASDINLYPRTQREVRERLARKMKFPWPGAIPMYVLNFYGQTLDAPGRLYTFVYGKPDRA